MRIGFDISQTGGAKAGCGYAADCLIRGLEQIDKENEYILYPTFGDFFWDPDHKKSVFQTPNPRFKRGLRHRYFEEMRIFWRNPPDDFEAQLGSPDILHANNFFCPGKLKNARLVYTLYDLNFVDHPEWTTEANRIGCFTGVFNASLYADYIVSISEASKSHFLSTFPHYPEDRIAVIYLPSRFGDNKTVDAEKPESLRDVNSKEFWLNVGTIEPRKKQKGLLAAYARLKHHLGKTFPLVFAGGQGWLMDDFKESIEKLGLEQDVIITGYVSDDSLQWLYQNCYALVYPSFFEGFGLPVLEAMTLGAPVIASNSTSIPEIVGDSGILVDPYNEEDIFKGLLELATSQGRYLELKEKALARSKHFSWKSSILELLEVYGKMVKMPRLHA